MARLRWNVVQRRWWTQPYAIVCVVALAGCLYALWWRHDLLKQRERLIDQAQILSHDATTREQRAFAPPPAALNQVFAEMRFPWTDMLDSLQRATKPGIDLLSLEPDAGAIRRVRISGVADEAQDLFDLVATLQGDLAWSSVQLISQARNDDTVIRRNNGSAPLELPLATPRRVSFALLAEWGRP